MSQKMAAAEPGRLFEEGTQLWGMESPARAERCFHQRREKLCWPMTTNSTRSPYRCFREAQRREAGPSRWKTAAKNQVLVDEIWVSHLYNGKRLDGLHTILDIKGALLNGGEFALSAATRPDYERVWEEKRRPRPPVVSGSSNRARSLSTSTPRILLRIAGPLSRPR